MAMWSSGYGTGGLDAFDGALGCLRGLPAGLRTHYAVAPRSRWRRAMNKLAKAQVTSQTVGVLVEPAIAHLGKAEHPLDDRDRLFDPGPDLRLGPIFRPLDLVL